MQLKNLLTSSATFSPFPGLRILPRSPRHQPRWHCQRPMPTSITSPPIPILTTSTGLKIRIVTLAASLNPFPAVADAAYIYSKRIDQVTPRRIQVATNLMPTSVDTITGTIQRAIACTAPRESSVPLSTRLEPKTMSEISRFSVDFYTPHTFFLMN